ncbi:hypothetical protein FRB94_000801 [Tulasnella sp. JGI-2019a]|nr:hypothetical protein FRB94_000801 [Tulasnella sp. JGI-2019a]
MAEKPTLASILDDVHCESALELVSHIRYATDPPGSTFISTFDDHITSITPAQFLSNESTLNRGDMIEIQGPAASGKTQLLQFFAMTCVLPNHLIVSCTAAPQESAETITEEPPSSAHVLLGGRAKCVAILDCDGRWCMQRLHAILSSYISSKFTRVFAPDAATQEVPPLVFDPSVSDLVAESLSRIHIFRPTSSLSLAATLSSLPTYHRRNIPDDEILMVFIDSISAFYHADKWKTEQATFSENSLRNSGKTQTTPRGAAEPSSSLSPSAFPRVDTNAMTHVVNTIQSLRRSLGIITIITNRALITPEGSSVVNLNVDVSAPWFGQHLSYPYPSIPKQPRAENTTPDAFTITHHITLPPTTYAVPQFSLGTTFAQALENSEEQKFIALIRTPVSTCQQEKLEANLDLRNKYQDGVAVGSFEFSVRDGFIGVG